MNQGNYLACMKAPLPRVWISDGGSIVENNTSGTYFLLEWKKGWTNIWLTDFTVKPVLSGHSKRRPKIGFQDQLSLNAGQKYC